MRRFSDFLKLLILLYLLELSFFWATRASNAFGLTGFFRLFVMLSAVVPSGIFLLLNRKAIANTLRRLTQLRARSIWTVGLPSICIIAIGLILIIGIQMREFALFSYAGSLLVMAGALTIAYITRQEKA
jgi:hypothetical protein